MNNLKSKSLIHFVATSLMKWEEELVLDDLLNIKELIIDPVKFNEDYDPTNLNELELFKNLEVLEISNMKITTDFNEKVLPTLTKLKGLSFYKCDLESLAGLDKLKDLETLYISKCNIKDVTNLNNLSGLKSLSLICQDFEDDEFLKNLINLEHLNLNNSIITNITNLEKLKRVKTLMLLNIKLDDFEFLNNLPMLENLYINDALHDDIKKVLKNNLSIYGEDQAILGSALNE